MIEPPLINAFQIAGKHALEAGLAVEPQQREIDELRERIETLERAIKSPPEGLHNAQTYLRQQEWFDEVKRGDSYENRSVIEVIPAVKPVAAAVWSSWLTLMTPANHKVHRMCMSDYEVGDAYEHAIDNILAKADLRDFSAVLTLETDNVIPPYAILRLFDDMAEAKVDVIGAMYWGKGPGGVPMAYGRYGDSPTNFRPFVPPANSVTRVNGVGMGCTLFKMDVFRRVSKPWFKTFQSWTANVGMESMATQDLFFAKKASAEAGIKFAVSTNVLVGHLDEETGIIW